MNKILNEIKKIVNENMEAYLPSVKASDLEENGKLYYMNGKNGTEFDWYVNNRISDFMRFYNDKDNLGAIKATLYTNGNLTLYLYNKKGKNLLKEVNTHLDVDEIDIFKLAVILRNEADDKSIWDADIESIDTIAELSNDKIEEFKENEKNYIDMKNKIENLNLVSCVSKKITSDGWKVGYMKRNEPINENDSGWEFFAGDEDENYTSNSKNIQLIYLGDVCQQFDPDIFRYINHPVGTKLIRVSSKEFEIDNSNKKIYMEKR